MAFTVGTEVIVLPLNRTGRIVEAGGKGRYRVALGAVASWYREAELSAVAEGGRKRKPPSSPRADHRVEWRRKADRSALASLDLHGMTVEEALRAVEVRLDEAIRGGLDAIQIIHGISGGRLRAAVHQYLKRVPAVARFGLDPGNPGVTRVWFA